MADLHPEIINLVAAGRLPAAVAPKVSTLTPETYVYSKSWGAGQVKEWDLLGDRMIVDFETKIGHAVKFEFAAKMMDAVPATHFLARRFADKDGLLKEALEKPAAFLKNVLESHGGRLAIELFEDAVRDKVVPMGKYKTWWDNTKKALRGEPIFIIPSKRNLPLELRQGEFSAEGALEQDIINSRDLKAKTKALEAIVKEFARFNDFPDKLSAIAKHVEEVAQQNLRLKTTESVDLLLLRDDLVGKVPALKEQVTFHLSDALSQLQEKLADFVGGLSAGKQARIFDDIAVSSGEDWVEKASTIFNKLNARSLSEIVKVVVKHGGKEKLNTWMKANIANRNLSSEALAWVCRERNGLAKEVFGPEIAGALMSAVERDHFDEDKKTNRVMENLVGDMNLIADLVGKSDTSVITNFARQVMLSSAFEELSKRSVMARIIKLAPEVQELVDAHGEEDSGPQEALIVSWPSLEAAKKALDHLTSVEIPKNRDDISIAREYGDLRENFEFKSAKEYQRVLMRRKMEAERDISRAQATDFADYKFDVVGIATVVTTKDTRTGATDSFTILGAWDSDPDKKILSYLAEAAQSLAGKSVGDVITLPTEEKNITRDVEIVSIKKWEGSLG